MVQQIIMEFLSREKESLEVVNKKFLRDWAATTSLRFISQPPITKKNVKTFREPQRHRTSDQPSRLGVGTIDLGVLHIF